MLRNPAGLAHPHYPLSALPTQDFGKMLLFNFSHLSRRNRHIYQSTIRDAQNSKQHYTAQLTALYRSSGKSKGQAPSGRSLRSPLTFSFLSGVVVSWAFVNFKKGEIHMQNKIRFSDEELTVFSLAVLRRALDNLTPEEIERAEKFSSQVKLTGFEHGGAWRREGI